MSQVTTAAAAGTLCPRCGSPLLPGALACPNCGLFTHLKELENLSSQAMQLEPANPLAAAALWQQALPLIPPDAQQHQMVQNRIAALTAGFARPQTIPYAAAPQAPPETLSRALFKTVGSMILSIIIYAFYFEDWRFAAGFVILMLVHELGHVIANRYYGLKAGPPVFIPFLGAIINLKERPANAKVEAVVGIGGPVLGTIGAIICYLIYLQTRIPVLGEVAFFGFLLNLFNLLPVPPLDGGRVTAAVTPWIWMLGLAGLGLIFYQDWRNGHFDWILVLVFFFAWPRIRATLRSRTQFGDYYNISRQASWTIAAIYIALGVLLLFLFQHTRPLVFPG